MGKEGIFFEAGDERSMTRRGQHLGATYQAEEFKLLGKDEFYCKMNEEWMSSLQPPFTALTCSCRCVVMDVRAGTRFAMQDACYAPAQRGSV
jgi:hypothetical protein